jgi:hypothetical protein
LFSSFSISLRIFGPVPGNKITVEIWESCTSSFARDSNVRPRSVPIVGIDDVLQGIVVDQQVQFFPAELRGGAQARGVAVDRPNALFDLFRGPVQKINGVNRR